MRLRKLSDHQTALRETSRIVSLPHLTILDVKPKHMVAALDLMQHHPRLRPRDALHAAVAMDAGVYSIVSSDPDFDAVPELGRVALEALRP
ncbi:MAG: PIN domain-containing protein [Euryarchaeota archaeon]|nr:PIN domain-containing protein [Euryarchaeota archaeon]